MHILELSQEILYEILQHSSNLFECSLVCRAWHVTALQLFYREVTLDQYRFYQTKQQMKLDPNERDGYFKYGSSVKVLKLNVTKNVYYNSPQGYDENSIPTLLDFDKGDFISFLECLPNIEALDLGVSFRGSKYLHFIFDAKSTKCLKRIRVIRPVQITGLSQESDLDNLEFHVGYKYRKTITTISLKYHSLMMNIGSRHDKTLNFLAQLSRLTHLSLMNTCDDDLTTLDLQRICPNLTDITYVSNRLIPDTIVKTILKDPSNPIFWSKLKYFKIVVPTIPLNYAGYITHFLPTQVQHLCVCLRKIYLFDWIDEIGLDNALALASRFSSIEKAAFYMCLDEGFRRKSSRYSSRMSTFFLFLHAFIGDKRPYCRFIFIDIEGDPVENFQITYSEGELHVRYPLSFDEYRFINVLDGTSFEVDSPDHSKSIIGLEIIQEMTFITDDSSHIKAINFINFIVTHCPDLEVLEYQCIEPLRKYCFSSAINPSVVIHQEELSAFSESPRFRMKTFITQDFYAIKTKFFAKYFPCIEFLACDYFGLENQATSVVVIDITRFRLLKTFYFAIDLLPNIEKHVIIQFDFSDGGSMRYALDMTNPFTKDPSKWDFLQNEDAFIRHRSMRIRCHKHVKIIIKSCQYGIIAEFLNGQLLDYVSIDSNFFNDDFDDDYTSIIYQ